MSGGEQAAARPRTGHGGTLTGRALGRKDKGEGPSTAQHPPQEGSSRRNVHLVYADRGSLVTAVSQAGVTAWQWGSDSIRPQPGGRAPGWLRMKSCQCGPKAPGPSPSQIWSCSFSALPGHPLLLAPATGLLPDLLTRPAWNVLSLEVT